MIRSRGQQLLPPSFDTHILLSDSTQLIGGTSHAEDIFTNALDDCHGRGICWTINSITDMALLRAFLR